MTDAARSIYGEFKAAAARAPDHVAIITEQIEISFRAAWHATETLRSGLAAQGLAPGRAIGVLMPPGPDLLPLLMAIMGSGACYVPLDPKDPKARHLRLLTRVGCNLLVGDGAAFDAIRQAAPEGLQTATVSETRLMAASASEPPPFGPDDTAYVLFTSGSTGEPKAVAASHGNVLALLDSAEQLLAFTAEDRYLAASSPTFDASVVEYFLPLTRGGAVALGDTGMLLDPPRLAKFVTKTQATVLQATPSVWSVVFNARTAFPHIKTLITHGEPVLPEVAKALLPHADRVLNLYGPTEATVWATGCDLTHGVPDTSSRISAPIGTPLAHVHVDIVDAEGRSVAPGEKGELILCGPSVAKGYLGDPDATAQRFFTHVGLRAYKTGDLACFGPDGLVHYFGRIDDQMTIRGLRIEPGEVEAVLADHADVHAVAVTWYDAAYGTHSILAGIVRTPNGTVTAEALNAHVEARLGASRRPSRYVFVDALPIKPSGKTDRKRLRDMVQSDLPQPAEPTAPVHDAMRDKIIEIWQAQLKTPITDPDADFFALGGDSLSTVEMLARVETWAQTDIPARTIFDHPTVRQFSDAVRALMESNDSQGANRQTDYDGAARPLFFVRADLGFASRAEALIGVPFVDLRGWDREDGLWQAKTLREMALRHLDEVRAVQQTGPYRLGGYSLGGVLAFEMARVLTERGEAVELLALVDPTPPQRFKPLAEASANNTVFGIAQAAVKSARHKARWMMTRGQRALAYYAVVAHLRRPTPLTRSFAGNEKTRRQAVSYLAQTILAKETLRPFSGRAVLYATSRENAETWAPLLTGTRSIYPVACHHRALFTAPYEADWTADLRGRLA